MKKILHIITGLNDGGAEGVLFRLCKHDHKENMHVVVSMMDEGKYASKLRLIGIPVHCLNLSRRTLTLKSVTTIWNLINSVRPDVVQTWMYHADLVGGLLAHFAKIKKITWGIRHSNLMSGKSARSTFFVAKCCALLSGWIPDSIVCCSQQASSIHQNLGYKKDKFIIIPNGYNLDVFQPNKDLRNQLRTEWRITEKTVLIGMVGRFDPQKDHQNLINALGIINRQGLDFRCLLVGRNMDNQNTQLVTWIRHPGIEDKVLLLGQRNDIPAIMNVLDVNVLSSSYGEAFPNVIAEAMACGTPCVTTDVGDAALIVGDTGWVVPPTDSQALSQAIETALIEYASNPTAWQARQKKARLRIVENFSIDRMVAAYNQVWSEA